MRILKTLLISFVLLGFSTPLQADVSDVPAAANWYFFLDLKQMNSDPAAKGVYAWLKDEIFDDVAEDIGVDLAQELDRLTSFSVAGEGGVVVFEGNISQATQDKVMTFVAAGGDITALKASGKRYFHFGGDEDIDDDVSYRSGKVRFNVESLGDEAWVSMGVKNKLIVTSTEAQMKTLLASNGKVAGARGHKGALFILTAEKALLQAGMKAGAFSDGDSSWDSNILRNTEQAAFLIAAAADKLAIEAELVTTEAEMAESLASVVRGLVSLVSFDDDIDAELASVLRSTKVSTKGNTLNISLALASDLFVAALRD